MTTIQFAGYLFYRYYSKGPQGDIRYFSTMCTMAFLGYLHLMQILILLDKVHLVPINVNDDGLTKRLIMFGILLPLYFVMTLLFKKKDIQSIEDKYEDNWDKILNGNVWLIAYVISSFGLTFILALLVPVQQPIME